MKCPRCGLPTQVLDTRERDGEVARRRKCDQGHRFSTRETVLTEQKKRLSRKEVVWIWRRLNQSPRPSLRSIAKDYGVTPRTISDILHGRSWVKLTQEINGGKYDGSNKEHV